jgi:hypothetical protein
MNKIKKYFYFLPGILMILSAAGKLSGAAPIVESLTGHGVPENLIPALGVLQLVCAVLFLIPRTQMIGFFMVCSYWGGVISTELIAEGHLEPVGIVVLALFWVAIFFKRPNLFLGKE